MDLNTTVILLLLFISVSFGTHYKAKYWEEFVENEDNAKEESYISCTCLGKNRRINIKKDERLKVYEKLCHFGYCEMSEKTEICTLYKDCNNCSFHMVECRLNAMTYKYNCLKMNFAVCEKKTSDVNTVSSRIPDRYKRAARYCRLPENSNTFDLICRKHSSFIKCLQICIRGYTLKKGITGRRRCFYKENKWQPTDFKECQPFVDCRLTLIGPGVLECSIATTTHEPSCNVSCEAFGSHQATPMETFECRITGTWDKELPFCVVPKAGIELVPPPNIDLYPFLQDLLTMPETER